MANQIDEFAFYEEQKAEERKISSNDEQTISSNDEQIVPND